MPPYTSLMNDFLVRRLFALVGPMIAGLAIGGGFDPAGISALGMRGLVAGVGFGLVALAFLKE